MSYSAYKYKLLFRVTESRDVCVLLQQYLTNKAESVNEVLKTKECLEKFVQDKKECANKQRLLVEQFKSKFVTMLQEPETIGIHNTVTVFIIS